MAVAEGGSEPVAQRNVILTTSRLVLTSWLDTDVDALLEVHSDPATMTYVRSGRPETRAETEQLVEQYIAEHAIRGWTKWRLADHDGRLLGRAGFGGQDDDRGLSYLIRRTHWGQGLATEIAEALVEWHLDHAAGAQLHALVAVGNDASARVLEKVGFDEVGTKDYAGTRCRVFSRSAPAWCDVTPMSSWHGVAPNH